jgi:hypothetical protein
VFVKVAQTEASVRLVSTFELSEIEHLLDSPSVIEENLVKMKVYT